MVETTSHHFSEGCNLPHHVTLDVADPDEVRDVITHGHTRADFFRRGAKAGGAVVAGGLVHRRAPRDRRSRAAA